MSASDNHGVDPGDAVYPMHAAHVPAVDCDADAHTDSDGDGFVCIRRGSCGAAGHGDDNHRASTFCAGSTMSGTRVLTAWPNLQYFDTAAVHFAVHQTLYRGIARHAYSDFDTDVHPDIGSNIDSDIRRRIGNGQSTRGASGAAIDRHVLPDASLPDYHTRDAHDSPDTDHPRDALDSSNAVDPYHADESDSDDQSDQHRGFSRSARPTNRIVLSTKSGRAEMLAQSQT